MRHGLAGQNKRMSAEKLMKSNKVYVSFIAGLSALVVTDTRWRCETVTFRETRRGLPHGYPACLHDISAH